jgi:hypothetical protein
MEKYKPQNLLSTRTIDQFPDIKTTKKLLQSITTYCFCFSEFNMFDYIKFENSTDCFCYWDDENFCCFFFNEFGSIIIGFDNDVEIHSKTVKNNLLSYPGLIENVPSEFKNLLELFKGAYPLKKIGFNIHYQYNIFPYGNYCITYCVWKTNSDEKWNIGNIDFKEMLWLEKEESDEIDGSKQKLCLLDGKPETFSWWNYMFVDGEFLDLELVKSIYAHKPLNANLSPELKDPKLKLKIEEIGYPID